MFCRLLGASGPDLRRLYLPGLEGLKAELRRFEFLMARYLPNLKDHLEVRSIIGEEERGARGLAVRQARVCWQGELPAPARLLQCGCSLCCCCLPACQGQPHLRRLH